MAPRDEIRKPGIQQKEVAMSNNEGQALDGGKEKNFNNEASLTDNGKAAVVLEERHNTSPKKVVQNQSQAAEGSTPISTQNRF